MKLLSLLIILMLSSCAGLQTRFHRVQTGDTIQKIASIYSVPANELENYNRESLSLGLRPGVKLYIPFEENPQWNEPERVVRTNIEDEEPVRAPVRKTASTQSYEIPLMRYIWPVSGSLSSRFGKRRGNFHEGIDIAAPRGRTVRAARAGHILYANNQISGYGNLVIVRHSDGYSTVYGHLSKFSVKKGQFIARGQALGNVGSTGHARGPHLHFEIRKGQIPVDPLTYLNGQLVARNARR